MQGWSLEEKIKVSQMKILEWYRAYSGQVFTSFSGGKDSTVLLDLARQVCPDIPAVYVDTGLEYPELRDFVKTKDNVIWLRPRYPFTQIIEKYGYPVISKEVSDAVSGARKGQPYRLARLNGELLDKNGKKSIYNCEKYKYLLDAPFAVSARCCYHMKKAPLNKFERQSGRHPITGVLACESKLREQSYLKFGCNGYERRRPLSQPLAFWREEDILLYLKMTGIPYAPIYGDIVEVKKRNGAPTLKTTGVSRSGCMYCMKTEKGFDTMVGEGGHTLSGGQKQRISIARAILKDAPIILLDEATSSVDPENEHLIQQAINQLVKNKTVVVIAHNLSAIRTVDKVLVLDEGQLLEEGDPSSLLQKKGLYSKLWGMSEKVSRWNAT